VGVLHFKYLSVQSDLWVWVVVVSFPAYVHGYRFFQRYPETFSSSPLSQVCAVSISFPLLFNNQACSLLFLTKISNHARDWRR
jgi:hypothetical protein